MGYNTCVVGEAIWTPICLEGAYEMIIRNAGECSWRHL